MNKLKIKFSNFFLLKLCILLLLVNSANFSSVKIKKKEDVKEYFKSFLLKKLDLQKEPSTFSDTKVPSYLLEIFKTNNDVLDKTSLTNDSNSIRNHHLDEPTKFFNIKENKSGFLIKFNLNLPKKEILNGAELLIFIDTSKKNCFLNKQLVVINEIIEQLIDFKDFKNQFVSNEEEKFLVYREIDTLTIDYNETKWLHFDVFSPIKKWFNNNTDNKGLLIKSFCFNDINYKNQFIDNLVLHPKNLNLLKNIKEDKYSEGLWKKQIKSLEWNNVKPLLLTYSKFQDLEYDVGQLDLLNKKKRHISSELPSSTREIMKSFDLKNEEKKNCSRYSMFVDFKEIGWEDWVIAPKGYEAFFCYGDCLSNLTEDTNTTINTTEQSLTNNLEPNIIAQPCCVPTDFAPISMIYKDGNTTVLKIFKDMVVTNCECRLAV